MQNSFRRSQQQQIHFSFVCKNFRSCDVNVVSRRKCQRCRYDRCVAAKMSPELVLNEEQKTFRFQRMIRKRRAMVASSTSGFQLPKSSTPSTSPSSSSTHAASIPGSPTSTSPTSISSTSDSSPCKFIHPGSVTPGLSPMDLSMSRSSLSPSSPDHSPISGFISDQQRSRRYSRDSSVVLVDYSKMPKLVPIRQEIPGPGLSRSQYRGLNYRDSNLGWVKSEFANGQNRLPDLIRSNFQIQLQLPPLVEISSYPFLQYLSNK